MTNPRHYLFLTFIYLLVVAGVCVLLAAPLRAAFMANWGFNLLIVAALCVGIAINVFQILRLEPEIKWIKKFRTGDPGLSTIEPPTLLSPLAKHLEEIHRDRFRLSAGSLSTVLDGIRGHLDEAREISKYMIGLLVFLGLLGTFWGLLQTIGTVSQVIGGLEVGTEDFVNLFDRLKQGLEGPLQGMGTAFSSSLFGLGGSLVLGFIDIQAGHAQNRFFNEMEEWLSGVTRLVDTDELPDGGLGASAEFLHAIDDHLRILINQMQKNNQAMAVLLKQQQKTPPDDSSEPKA
ncbi:MAG: biopolymer transporter ExbB [Desulfotignum sp.]|nr:biopolymer transporter ExbB [Desulfotignum sp.]MCF8112595.1 biopolymer transporter ExbB [Desulfotignum sp.]MCF8124935.1 biopolymer transporter ExbB [Desulfotignum sp.]